MRDDKRARAGRVFSVEGLEGRTLLSMGVVSHPAAEVAALRAARPARATVVRGQLNGTLSAYTPADTTSTLNTELNGQGSARGIPGTITVRGFENSQLNGTTLSASQGIATLTTQSGTIVVSYSGSGRLRNKGLGSQRITLNGSVVGGTGAYANQGGTFSGTVTANAITQGFSLSFQLRTTARA